MKRSPRFYFEFYLSTALDYVSAWSDGTGYMKRMRPPLAVYIDRPTVPTVIVIHDKIRLTGFRFNNGASEISLFASHCHYQHEDERQQPPGAPICHRATPHSCLCRRGAPG